MPAILRFTAHCSFAKTPVEDEVSGWLGAAARKTVSRSLAAPRSDSYWLTSSSSLIKADMRRDEQSSKLLEHRFRTMMNLLPRRTQAVGVGLH